MSNCPTIKVDIKSTKILVTSPFHHAFPTAARKLGGKFTGGVWEFDLRDEARVRALLIKIFGTDDSETAELVTIRAPGKICDTYNNEKEFWLAGRQIARALGRDSGARLGDGVVLLTGKFNSGGSMKNFRCTRSDNCVFELRDVPRATAEAVYDTYHDVTLLDTAGNVIAEPTSEPTPETSPDLKPEHAPTSVEPSIETTEVLLLEQEEQRLEAELAVVREKLAALRQPKQPAA